MKKLLLFLFALNSYFLSAQVPINDNVTPMEACMDNGFATFALEAKTPEILLNVSPDDVSISWHWSLADAQTGQNPVMSPIMIQESTMVFARVQWNSNPNDFSVTDFGLLVNLGPEVFATEYVACNEWLGNNMIDLLSVAEQIWGQFGLSPNDVEIGFYESEAAAYAGFDQLSSPYTIGSSTQIIWAASMNYLTGCRTISPVYVTLQNCGMGGQPENLFACTDTSSACFDMSANIQNVLANLNPDDYTVSFHLSQADADSNTAAITNIQNYCTPVTMQNTIIYTRLTDNETGEYSVSMFALVGQQYTVSNFQMQEINACDDDANGFAMFDLVSAAAVLGTANSLQFYQNSNDAGAGVNPITNPAQYVAVASNLQTVVFIREVITGECDIIHSLPLRAYANCNIASSCLGANALCGSLGVPFSNTVNIDGLGGDFNCLGSTPNPTWFYIPVSVGGSLNFQISQEAIGGNDIDIDFICWGPFDDPVAACSSQLNSNNVVGCSYSVAAIENFNLVAQPGKYYILMVTNYSNQPGSITIDLLSGTGEIDCTGMHFNAFLDYNNNTTKDANEPNFPMGNFSYVKNDDGVVHNITSPNGNHTIYDIDPANTYDVSFTIDPQYASYYTSATPSFQNLSVISGGGTTDYYFPISITENYDDLSVAVIPVGQPQPGFNYAVKVQYANLSGQFVANPAIEFTKDPLVSIVSVSAPGFVLTPTGFTYSATGMMPFETRSITVTMNVPTIPTVALGDILTSTAGIEPNSTDLTPENNTSSSSQVVIGSYDPNDKMESRGGQILIDNFGADDYLYYTIRFENSGTAPATSVRVNDVIDSSLDPSSIRMISASHDYVMDRVGNVVNWNFTDIILPPASQNPTAAQGFVHFKIKPVPGFAVGDIIPNTASIFFDFNPPIITNTFETEFVDQLSVEEISGVGFTVYPNPASTQINIVPAEGIEISSATIFDITGKVIFRSDSGRVNSTIDVSAMSSGLYLLEIRDNAGRKTTKRIAIQ